MDILGPDGERRKFARNSGFKSAEVVSVDGSSKEACVVVNLSETGALLLVEKPDLIADQVALHIDGEHEHRAARVVWRTSASVSVSFLDAEDNELARDGWVFAPRTSKAS